MHTRFTGLLVTVACAGQLLGCAAIPSTTPTQSPRMADSFAGRQSFSAPLAQWPADEWWRSYGDPQLASLITEALRDSPTLAAAQARILKARSLAQEANAAIWPTVDGNGSFQKYRQSYNEGFPPALVPHGFQNSTRATLDSSYEFDFFGRNRAALAAATSEEEASHTQSVYSLERLVNDQSIMLSTNQVFMGCAVAFLVAACAIWLSPRPKHVADTSGVH